MKGRVQAWAWKAQGGFSISEQVLPAWGVKDGNCSALPEREGVQEGVQADKIENKMKHYLPMLKGMSSTKKLDEE